MSESALFFIAAGIWMLVVINTPTGIGQLCNAGIELFLIAVAWWRFFEGNMK